MDVKILHLGAIGISSNVIAIADQKGLFRRRGIDVQVEAVQGTQIPNLSEETPMGHIGAPAALMRFAAMGNLKIIASFDKALLSECLLVRSDIATPLDLRGKKLGARVTGAALWLHTVQAVEKLGLNLVEDRVEIAEVGDPPAIIAALERGDIDGAVLSRAHCNRLVPKGYRILLDLAPLKMYGAPDALVVSDTLLENSRATARTVLAAMIEAVACAMSAPDDRDVIEAIKSNLQIKDDEFAKQALAEFRSSVSLKPYPSLERLENMQRMMALPRPAVIDTKISEMIDDTLLRELDESGFIDDLSVAYESHIE